MPKRIGPYRILQELGEGGFGAVYMAEQEHPFRRRVALKVIKLGMDTRQVVARFEQERQALALMDHPNIAKVLDAGATEQGRPYFVMELVRGVPITAYCDSAQLSTRERLELFVPICQAIQHAHQKGVIHRDIKPGNILVTLHDGKPVPKIIDFGIAKATDHRLTERTLFTEHHAMVGTPAYMSPEQAELSGLDIDTRTDVYSLGVLLYELLTGTTPFKDAELRAAGYAGMQRMIREQEPPKPSTRVSTLGDAVAAIAHRRKVEPKRLGTLLRGDLDWVVMKALEKDRTRRYDTAADLGQDIQRHLTGDAVQAAPPGAAYRVRKFVRRNKGLVIAVGAVSAALLLGLSIAAYFVVQSLRSETLAAESLQKSTAAEQLRSEAAEVAEKARRERDRAMYRTTLGAAASALQVNSLTLARERLDACPRSERGIEWSAIDQRAREPVYNKFGTFLAFTPDSTRFLAASYESQGELVLYETQSGRELWRIKADFNEIFRVQFSRSAESVLLNPRGGARLFNLATPGDFITLPTDIDDRPYNTVTFSPDETRIVTSSDSGTAQLWDARSGNSLGRLTGHRNTVTDAEFDPSGERVVTASWDMTAIIWDAVKRQPISVLVGHTNGLNSARFSASGTTVLTCSDDNTARVWDAQTGACVRVIDGGEMWLKRAEFALDGESVIIQREGDTTLTIEDARTGAERYRLPEHESPIALWEQNRSSRLISTVTVKGVARVFSADDGRHRATLSCAVTGCSMAQTSPDARWIALTHQSGYELRKLEPGTEPNQWSAGVNPEDWYGRGESSVMFAPGGTGRALIGGVARRFQLIDSDGGGNVARLFQGEEVDRRLFDPTGRRLLLMVEPWREPDGDKRSLRSRRMWLIDARSGTPVTPQPLETHAVFSRTYFYTGTVVPGTFSQDGELTATIRMGRSVDVWSADDGKPVASLAQTRETQFDLSQVAFSPDGECIWASNERGIGIVWNIRTGRELTRVHLPLANGTASGFVSFSPVGHRMYASAPEGHLRLLDTRCGDAEDGCEPDRRPIRLRGDAQNLVSGWFSRDGTRFIGSTRSATGDGVNKVWCVRDKFDPETGRVSRSAGDEVIANDTCSELNNATATSQSPDGKHIAATLAAGTIALFGMENGELVGTMRVQDAQLAFVNFSPSGTHAATTDARGSVHIWKLRPEGGDPMLLREYTRIGPSSSTNNGVFSPDGSKLALFWGTRGTVLNIMDPGDYGRELRAVSQSGFAVSFSGDGTRVTATAGNHIIGVWNASDGQALPPVGAVGEDTKVLAFNPDLTRVAVKSRTGEVYLLDATTGARIRELWRESEPLGSAAVSADASLLITANRMHSRPQVWDTRTRTKTVKLAGHDAGVRCVAVTPDGRAAVTGSDDTTAIAWDTSTGKPQGRFSGHERAVVAVAISPDATRVLTAAEDGSARLWDVRDAGQPVAVLSGHGQGVFFTGFSDDGRKVLTVSPDCARIWDGVTGAPVGAELRHAGGSTITAAALSPDGARSVTCAENKTVRLWDTSTGLLVGSDWVLESPARSAMYSLGGARVLFGTAAGPVEIRDARSGTQVGVLRGHDAPVTAGWYTADGSRVFTASRDRSIRIWDPSDGTELHTFGFTASPCTGLWTSPDNRLIISLGELTTNITIRDLKPDRAK